MIGRNGFRNTPQQGRSQRLVELIIDTTAHILADGGPAALNTNAVAEAAGISVGSLYRYFPHKESLVAAVIEREGRRFHDRIRSRRIGIAATTAEETVAHVVAITVQAYRSAAADDVLQSIEMRPGGLFDRRIGALTAVTAELRTAAIVACDTVLNEAAPILAEIIVALIESAMVRPSPGLMITTVGATATGAATAYLALMWRHESSVPTLPVHRDILG